jgi:DNA-3-methyladenine glycosylase I
VPRDDLQRCAWVGDEPLSQAYHDEEWGVPVHDDRLLFEFLVPEGAQAGLSWLTILRKREGYRRAFAGFDPAAVAAFGPKEVERLLADPGIIRNRLKIESAITNAQKFLRVQREFGSFDAYVWGFVAGETIHNEWRTMAEIPPKTPEAERMSADLKKQGFRFVGPTICYAHMQATGMVNDHTVDCFRYQELRPDYGMSGGTS